MLVTNTVKVINAVYDSVLNFSVDISLTACKLLIQGATTGELQINYYGLP